MDDLPSYSCSVAYSATVDYKAEWSGPFQKASRRSWTTVTLQVHGTILAITPKTLGGGRATQTYTLQEADVGRAADYTKRAFALRVRAEGSQFLLAASGLSKGLALYEAIAAAIAISLPLDERCEPAPPSFRHMGCLALRNGTNALQATSCSCCVAPLTFSDDDNQVRKQLLTRSGQIVATGSTTTTITIHTGESSPTTLNGRTHMELLKAYSGLRNLRYDSKVCNGRFVVQGKWQDAPEMPLEPMPPSSRWRIKIPF